MEIVTASSLKFIKPDGYKLTQRYNKGINLKSVIYSLLLELNNEELEEQINIITNLINTKIG